MFSMFCWGNSINISRNLSRLARGSIRLSCLAVDEEWPVAAAASAENTRSGEGKGLYNKLEKAHEGK